MRQGHSFLTNCVLYTKHTHFQSRDFSYNHLCHDKTNRTINSSSNVQMSLTTKTARKKILEMSMNENLNLKYQNSNHQIQTNEFHCCQLTRFLLWQNRRKILVILVALKSWELFLFWFQIQAENFWKYKNVGGIFRGPRPRYQTKSRTKHN